MSDPSGSSSDPGYLKFRAAAALATAPGAGEGRPVPPPLPPPPPGVVPMATAPGPSSATAQVAPPPGPPLPPPGSGPAAAWETLAAWCVASGLSTGGLLADAGGRVVASVGSPPPAEGGALARWLASSAADARGAAGEGSAAALDLCGTWATGFAVTGPGGAWLAVLWGRAPVRAGMRDALAAWLASALAR